MKKNTLVLSLLLLFSISSYSQEKIVNDGNIPEAEFHVVMNPLDSNHMVIATMQGFDDEENGNNIVIYYTFDGGDNWSISDFHAVLEGFEGSGDPVLAFDANGDVLLVNLMGRFTENDVKINTVIFRSTDGGNNWEHTVDVVVGLSDKPWVDVDNNPNSEYLGNIYIPVVGFTQLSMYSFNSSFEELSNVTIPDGDALPCVVVGNDGDVFSSTIGLGDTSNVIYLQYYTEGGSKLERSKEVIRIPDYTFGAPWISTRFQPTVYMAFDNSGGIFDGRLYMSYTASEESDRDYFDVFLIYSDDKGESWSEPKVVHQDGLINIQQFYSSLYLNKNGVLIMDWYDRRNHPDSTKLTDFYMGISADGGESFAELQLNTVASDFDDVIPSYNFGIGEYHQVVASKHSAYSFWSDGRTNDGDLNLYMSKVSIADPSSTVEISTLSDKVHISSIYPQPAKDNIYLDIKLKQNMSIQMNIVDNKGRIIWQNSAVNYNQGKHIITIPTQISSGIYYLNIVSDSGYLKTKKFVKL